VHTICVNTLGTVASTITVDDALTATTPTIGVINSLTLLGCQTLDVAFATGLTIVTTGTAAPDVTVSYR
jgi:Ca2+/Na+ antiporter